MIRRPRIALAALAGLSLVAAACGGSSESKPVETTAAAAVETTKAAEPAGTEAPAPATDPAPAETEAPEPTEPPATEAPALEASEVGVTEDTIKIGVAIADLEAVRAAGISIPETLTNEHLLSRWTNEFDAWNEAGGINGRKVEALELNWDPLNPASFDALCAEATINNELYIVINGTGLSSIAQECILDAGVPIVYGDVVSQELLDTGILFTLAPPAQVTAPAGVEAWAKTTDIAPGSKIGVLASNTPLIQAAGKATADAITAAGFEPVVIELNDLSGDNAATTEEGGAAVGTFLAQDVKYVFVATQFTINGGFWRAAAGKLPYTMLDTASSQCSVFGLSRAPGDSNGALCTTAFDHPANDKGEIRADTDFEAKCRATWDKNYAEVMGGPSNPGVPSGTSTKDVGGKQLSSDYSPLECTITNFLGIALADAGLNPTRESFVEAMEGLGQQPFAAGSNGMGTFSADKHYLADEVHTIRITASAADVAADDKGLYNGCPAPVTCGVVISDWTPIAAG